MKKDFEQIFDFALYLDEQIICKRKFRSYRYQNVNKDYYDIILLPVTMEEKIYSD